MHARPPVFSIDGLLFRISAGFYLIAALSGVRRNLPAAGDFTMHAAHPLREYPCHSDTN